MILRTYALLKLLMISGDRSLAQGKMGAFYNTLEEFHKYWDRIDIICPKAVISNSKLTINENPNYQLPTTNYFNNVFIHPSPWPLWLQPFWILKKGQEIYLAQKFDLITVHEYPPFYNGLGARLLRSKLKFYIPMRPHGNVEKEREVPYLLEILHVPGYPKAASLKELFYKWFAGVFIKYDAAKAAAVRVINQKQTPEFLIKAGVPKEKIKYIPAFYIDLETFRPILEIQKKYDLVFAARLEKNKGINLLIQAIKIAKQSKPDISLLIIGSGPEIPNLRLLITNHKLQNNVFFSDWLETLSDVANAYNSARIFINPSFNEGGPRVVLEAMACGLPVITTRVGLMPDIIKNGDNGLFADWNPYSMADRILHLLYSEKLQKQFSVSGLELVKQFEKKAAIRNYAEKLRGLI